MASPSRYCPHCDTPYKPPARIRGTRKEFLADIALFGCGGCGCIFFGSVGSCFVLATVTSGAIKSVLTLAGVALLVGALGSVLWGLISRRG